MDPHAAPIDPALHRLDASEVVARLRAAGHEAFFVGGCVRDRLLGRTPREYDIATDAHPADVQRIFRHTIPVGVQFGVIIVVTRISQYEVATFRADTAYEDGRRPNGVLFVSAREDVLRRDFTINGLLEDPASGDLCDFVGGRADLAARLIRAIGDPEARFVEDHLRALRAIRFAATLGFTIEAATFDAIRAMADRVTSVSGERLHQELSRLFSEGDACRGAVLLAESGLLALLLPEATLREPMELQTAFGNLATVDLVLALALLVGLLGGEALADTLGRRLRLSRGDHGRLTFLLREAPALDALSTRAARLRLVREPHGGALLAVARAWRTTRGGDLDTIAALEALSATTPPEQLHPPRWVTGEELKAMGARPGPAFKAVLRAVEDAQLEGEVTSAEQALALAARLIVS